MKKKESVVKYVVNNKDETIIEEEKQMKQVERKQRWLDRVEIERSSKQEMSRDELGSAQALIFNVKNL